MCERNGVARLFDDPAPLIVAAADHYRVATEIGIAQKFDRRIKRVHVEMGDAASDWRYFALGALQRQRLERWLR